MRPLIIILCLIFLFSCGNSPQPDTNPQTASVQTASKIEIRGNRASRIYHWKGCPNYYDIKPSNRKIFNSAQEAEKAGYRAAKNCQTVPPKSD